MSDSHYADIAAAIGQRLAAGWTTTPILNENLDESLIQTSGEMPDSFIVLEILYLTNDQVDIGDPGHRRYRTRGVIKIHILTPTNKGDGLGLEYADTLAAIFRGKSFSGVICYGATMRGQQEKASADGRYWRVTLGIDFYSDKIFDIT